MDNVVSDLFLCTLCCEQLTTTYQYMNKNYTKMTPGYSWRCFLINKHAHNFI